MKIRPQYFEQANFKKIKTLPTCSKSNRGAKSWLERAIEQPLREALNTTAGTRQTNRRTDTGTARHFIMSSPYGGRAHYNPAHRERYGRTDTRKRIRKILGRGNVMMVMMMMFYIMSFRLSLKGLNTTIYVNVHTASPSPLELDISQTRTSCSACCTCTHIRHRLINSIILFMFIVLCSHFCTRAAFCQPFL